MEWIRAGLLIVWAVTSFALPRTAPGQAGAMFASMTMVLAICNLVDAAAGVGVLLAFSIHAGLALPTGRLESRSRRSLAVVGYVFGFTLWWVWSNRPDLPGWPLPLIISVAVGAIGVALRYRLSNGVNRRRLQWTVSAAVFTLTGITTLVGARVLFGGPKPLGELAAILTVTFPLGLGAGTNIRWLGLADRALALAIRVGGFWIFVVGGFVLFVGGLGGAPTRDERAVLALCLLAAAVAAASFKSVWTRLDRVAGRIAYGGKPSPESIVKGLADRLTKAMPVDELLLQLAESLHGGLRLKHTEIWTSNQRLLERTISLPHAPRRTFEADREALEVLARSGITGQAWLEIWLPGLAEAHEGSNIRVAPATHAGEVLALILVEREAEGDPFTDADDGLLTDIARQIGSVLHNVRLDTALQDSLADLKRHAHELQASRARIVAAADAERRRIERDLHDGAQQSLVALSVRLAVARSVLEEDPVQAAVLLDDLKEQTREAIAEVRGLAHGIYPPVLQSGGLSEALSLASSRSPLPTEVELTRVGRYTQEVEAAIYFCCLESLQNAGKHAGSGAHAVVRVEAEDGWVRFEVRDDGAGYDPEKVVGHGHGFVNMSDRLGAVGGKLLVSSSPGEGTTVSGLILLDAVPREDAETEKAETS